MRVTNPLVALAVALGARRAWKQRGVRAPADRDRQLRYAVPVGQDPAAVLAAVYHAGFGATVEWAGREENVVIDCDPVLDRERLRDVLAKAPIDMAGHPFHGPPVTFADE